MSGERPPGSGTMRTMVPESPGRPLLPVERPIPRAGPGQLLLRVRACGVCRAAVVEP